MKRIYCLLTAIVLSTSLSAQPFKKGDINEDGDVTIADVTMLVDIILGKINPEPSYADGIIIDGYRCVYLGTSSGDLWATTNIGASSPEEAGDFFSWGETEGTNEGKQTFSWATYEWSGHTFDHLLKYCTESARGTVDNLTEIDFEDDAAYNRWSRQWRIPTQKQMNELLTECTWTWTTYNNVSGYEVKGPNGNAIFIPAAGVYDINGYRSDGETASLWTRSLVTSSCMNAYTLVGNQNEAPVITDIALRYCGRNIRPVAYIK